MDVHVPFAVTQGLRQRGIDVLTAQEAGLSRAVDESLPTRATELDRLLITQDDDLLAIGSRWSAEGRAFSAIVYSHQLGAGIGEMIEDLELLAFCATEDEMRNQVVFLPLRYSSSRLPF